MRGVLLACCVKSYVLYIYIFVLRVFVYVVTCLCVVYDGSCDVVGFLYYCFCVFDCLFAENVIGCCDCELMCGDV